MINIETGCFFPVHFRVRVRVKYVPVRTPSDHITIALLPRIHNQRSSQILVHTVTCFLVVFDIKSTLQRLYIYTHILIWTHLFSFFNSQSLLHALLAVYASSAASVTFFDWPNPRQLAMP